MQNIRDQAIDAFQKLPKNASAEDLQYQLYVLEKIRRSEEAISARGTVSHAEAKQRMRKWLTK